MITDPSGENEGSRTMPVDLNSVDTFPVSDFTFRVPPNTSSHSMNAMVRPSGEKAGSDCEASVVDKCSGVLLEISCRHMRPSALNASICSSGERASREIAFTRNVSGSRSCVNRAGSIKRCLAVRENGISFGRPLSISTRMIFPPAHIAIALPSGNQENRG